MRKGRWITMALVLAAGCAADPTGLEPDPLTGIIASRAAHRVGVSDGQGGVRTDSSAMMLVDGTTLYPALDRCLVQARYFIGGETRVYVRREKRLVSVDTAELRVGRLVSVWGSGTTLDACPVFTSARKVLIHDGP